MSTIKGLGFSDIEPQPGFTATQDETGGWTGSHKFAIRRTAWANASVRGQFIKGVSITALDSGLASYWSFLKVVTRTVDSEEGDFTMVSVTFSGAEGATYGEDGGLAEDTEPTYRLSGQLQDAPMSLHPKWAALSDIEKAGLGLLIRGQAEYDLPTFKVGQFSIEDQTFYAIKDSDGTEIVMDAADAKEFALRIARGDTTYLRPVLTWTESTQGQTGLTNAQLNLLGNIATPRGSPPEAAGTRDWQLTSAFQETRGELTTTDLEWTLSEKGGHDDFLYGT
jgi:hypothetical protein